MSYRGKAFLVCRCSVVGLFSILVEYSKRQSIAIIAAKTPCLFARAERTFNNCDWRADRKEQTRCRRGKRDQRRRNGNAFPHRTIHATVTITSTGHSNRGGDANEQNKRWKRLCAKKKGGKRDTVKGKKDFKRTRGEGEARMLRLQQKKWKGEVEGEQL